MPTVGHDPPEGVVQRADHVVHVDQFGARTTRAVFAAGSTLIDAFD